MLLLFSYTGRVLIDGRSYRLVSWRTLSFLHIKCERAILQAVYSSWLKISGIVGAMPRYFFNVDDELFADAE